MSLGFFIAGTDTGVGKTYVSCLLLHYWRQQGYRVKAWKPCAAGAEPSEQGLRNDDGLALLAAQGGSQSYAQLNPICLPDPMSPHLAAQKAGIDCSLSQVLSHWPEFDALTAERFVVEGAGGWLCPLTAEQSFADLAKALKLPVILVVGLRLGCLNHALLSAQSIQTAGLKLAGWIGCQLSPDMAGLQGNLDYLQQQLAAPCLAQVGYQQSALQLTLDGQRIL